MWVVKYNAVVIQKKQNDDQIQVSRNNCVKIYYAIMHVSAILKFKT